jgi:hypothetical protein
MGNARLMEPEVAVIVGDHDAPLGTGEGKLLFVRCTLQARISCGRDIDAPAPQPPGDHRVDVLIKMEADPRWHRGRLIFEGSIPCFLGGFYPDRSWMRSR